MRVVKTVQTSQCPRCAKPSSRCGCINRTITRQRKGAFSRNARIIAESVDLTAYAIKSAHSLKLTIQETKADDDTPPVPDENKTCPRCILALEQARESQQTEPISNILCDICQLKAEKRNTVRVKPKDEKFQPGKNQVDVTKIPFNNLDSSEIKNETQTDKSRMEPRDVRKNEEYVEKVKEKVGKPVSLTRRKRLTSSKKMMRYCFPTVSKEKVTADAVRSAPSLKSTTQNPLQKTKRDDEAPTDENCITCSRCSKIIDRSQESQQTEPMSDMLCHSCQFRAQIDKLQAEKRKAGRDRKKDDKLKLGANRITKSKQLKDDSDSGDIQSTIQKDNSRTEPYDVSKKEVYVEKVKEEVRKPISHTRRKNLSDPKKMKRHRFPMVPKEEVTADAVRSPPSLENTITNPLQETKTDDDTPPDGSGITCSRCLCIIKQAPESQQTRPMNDMLCDHCELRDQIDKLKLEKRKAASDKRKDDKLQRAKNQIDNTKSKRPNNDLASEEIKNKIESDYSRREPRNVSEKEEYVEKIEEKVSKTDLLTRRKKLSDSKKVMSYCFPIVPKEEETADAVHSTPSFENTIQNSLQETKIDVDAPQDENQKTCLRCLSIINQASGSQQVEPMSDILCDHCELRDQIDKLKVEKRKAARDKRKDDKLQLAENQINVKKSKPPHDDLNSTEIKNKIESDYSRREPRDISKKEEYSEKIKEKVSKTDLLTRKKKLSDSKKVMSYCFPIVPKEEETADAVHSTPSFENTIQNSLQETKIDVDAPQDENEKTCSRCLSIIKQASGSQQVEPMSDILCDHCELRDQIDKLKVEKRKAARDKRKDDKLQLAKNQIKVKKSKPPHDDLDSAEIKNKIQNSLQETKTDVDAPQDENEKTCSRCLSIIKQASGSQQIEPMSDILCGHCELRDQIDTLKVEKRKAARDKRKDDKLQLAENQINVEKSKPPHDDLDSAEIKNKIQNSLQETKTDVDAPQDENSLTFSRCLSIIKYASELQQIEPMSGMLCDHCELRDQIDKLKVEKRKTVRDKRKDDKLQLAENQIDVKKSKPPNDDLDSEEIKNKTESDYSSRDPRDVSKTEYAEKIKEKVSKTDLLTKRKKLSDSKKVMSYCFPIVPKEEETADAVRSTPSFENTIQNSLQETKTDVDAPQDENEKTCSRCLSIIKQASGSQQIEPISDILCDHCELRDQIDKLKLEKKKAARDKRKDDKLQLAENQIDVKKSKLPHDDLDSAEIKNKIESDYSKREARDVSKKEYAEKIKEKVSKTDLLTRRKKLSNSKKVMSYYLSIVPKEEITADAERCTPTFANTITNPLQETKTIDDTPPDRSGITCSRCSMIIVQSQESQQTEPMSDMLCDSCQFRAQIDKLQAEKRKAGRDRQKDDKLKLGANQIDVRKTEVLSNDLDLGEIKSIIQTDNSRMELRKVSKKQEYAKVKEKVGKPISHTRRKRLSAVKKVMCYYCLIAPKEEVTADAVRSAPSLESTITNPLKETKIDDDKPSDGNRVNCPKCLMILKRARESQKTESVSYLPCDYCQLRDQIKKLQDEKRKAGRDKQKDDKLKRPPSDKTVANILEQTKKSSLYKFKHSVSEVNILQTAPLLQMSQSETSLLKLHKEAYLQMKPQIQKTVGWRQTDQSELSMASPLTSVSTISHLDSGELKIFVQSDYSRTEPRVISKKKEYVQKVKEKPVSEIEKLTEDEKMMDYYFPVVPKEISIIKQISLSSLIRDTQEKIRKVEEKKQEQRELLCARKLEEVNKKLKQELLKIAKETERQERERRSKDKREFAKDLIKKYGSKILTTSKEGEGDSDEIKKSKGEAVKERAEDKTPKKEQDTAKKRRKKDSKVKQDRDKDMKDTLLKSKDRTKLKRDRTKWETDTETIGKKKDSEQVQKKKRQVLEVPKRKKKEDEVIKKTDTYDSSKTDKKHIKSKYDEKRQKAKYHDLGDEEEIKENQVASEAAAKKKDSDKLAKSKQEEIKLDEKAKRDFKQDDVSISMEEEEERLQERRIDVKRQTAVPEITGDDEKQKDYKQVLEQITVVKEQKPKAAVEEGAKELQDKDILGKYEELEQEQLKDDEIERKVIDQKDVFQKQEVSEAVAVGKETDVEEIVKAKSEEGKVGEKEIKDEETRQKQEQDDISKTMHEEDMKLKEKEEADEEKKEEGEEIKKTLRQPEESMKDIPSKLRDDEIKRKSVEQKDILQKQEASEAVAKKTDVAEKEVKDEEVIKEQEQDDLLKKMHEEGKKLKEKEEEDKEEKKHGEEEQRQTEVGMIDIPSKLRDDEIKRKAIDQKDMLQKQEASEAVAVGQKTDVGEIVKVKPEEGKQGEKEVKDEEARKKQEQDDISQKMHGEDKKLKEKEEADKEEKKKGEVDKQEQRQPEVGIEDIPSKLRDDEIKRKAIDQKDVLQKQEASEAVAVGQKTDVEEIVKAKPEEGKVGEKEIKDEEARKKQEQDDISKTMHEGDNKLKDKEEADKEEKKKGEVDKQEQRQPEVGIEDIPSKLRDDEIKRKAIDQKDVLQKQEASEAVAVGKKTDVEEIVKAKSEEGKVGEKEIKEEEARKKQEQDDISKSMHEGDKKLKEKEDADKEEKKIGEEDKQEQRQTEVGMKDIPSKLRDDEIKRKAIDQKDVLQKQEASEAAAVGKKTDVEEIIKAKPEEGKVEKEQTMIPKLKEDTEKKKEEVQKQAQEQKTMVKNQEEEQRILEQRRKDEQEMLLMISKLQITEKKQKEEESQHMRDKYEKDKLAKKADDKASRKLLGADEAAKKKKEDAEAEKRKGEEGQAYGKQKKDDEGIKKEKRMKKKQDEEQRLKEEKRKVEQEMLLMISELKGAEKKQKEEELQRLREKNKNDMLAKKAADEASRKLLGAEEAAKKKIEDAEAEKRKREEEQAYGKQKTDDEARKKEEKELKKQQEEEQRILEKNRKAEKEMLQMISKLKGAEKKQKEEELQRMREKNKNDMLAKKAADEASRKLLGAEEAAKKKIEDAEAEKRKREEEQAYGKQKKEDVEARKKEEKELKKKLEEEQRLLEKNRKAEKEMLQMISKLKGAEKKQKEEELQRMREKNKNDMLAKKAADEASRKLLGAEEAAKKKIEDAEAEKRKREEEQAYGKQKKEDVEARKKEEKELKKKLEEEQRILEKNRKAEKEMLQMISKLKGAEKKQKEEELQRMREKNKNDMLAKKAADEASRKLLDAERAAKKKTEDAEAEKRKREEEQAYGKQKREDDEARKKEEKELKKQQEEEQRILEKNRKAEKEMLQMISKLKGAEKKQKEEELQRMREKNKNDMLAKKAADEASKKLLDAERAAKKKIEDAEAEKRKREEEQAYGKQKKEDDEARKKEEKELKKKQEEEQRLKEKTRKAEHDMLLMISNLKGAERKQKEEELQRIREKDKQDMLAKKAADEANKKLLNAEEAAKKKLEQEEVEKHKQEEKKAYEKQKKEEEEERKREEKEYKKKLAEEERLREEKRKQEQAMLLMISKLKGDEKKQKEEELQRMREKDKQDMLAKKAADESKKKLMEIEKAAKKKRDQEEAEKRKREEEAAYLKMKKEEEELKMLREKELKKKQEEEQRIREEKRQYEKEMQRMIANLKEEQKKQKEEDRKREQEQKAMLAKQAADEAARKKREAEQAAKEKREQEEKEKKAQKELEKEKERLAKEEAARAQREIIEAERQKKEKEEAEKQKKLGFELEITKIIAKQKRDQEEQKKKEIAYENEMKNMQLKLQKEEEAAMSKLEKQNAATKKTMDLIYLHDTQISYDDVVVKAPKAVMQDIIIGETISKFKPPLPPDPLSQDAPDTVIPMMFKKTDYSNESINVPSEHEPMVVQEVDTKIETDDKKTTTGVPASIENDTGVIRYALSDRRFIDKGWTVLPVEKVVRKMNVYRMRPAQPEFNWFENNKKKQLMTYDTGEKLAEFDEDGRCRWYYRNGRLALDYYNAEELNAQQRFVVYSNGEPDDRGRSRPYTVLATFDFLGSGVVFDHGGKIRLTYNQTEGVVLDREIGPTSTWKWHSLNDPPILQQVMLDCKLAQKDQTIYNMGEKKPVSAVRGDDQMQAIEFENFLKDKKKKLTQKFKPFQIKMKALKINESFSLKVLDQATIYLIFREGSANIKLNIGMILDNKEIIDTDTAELGVVSTSVDRFPAATDSVAALQRSVAHAQRFERNRTERERIMRPPPPADSADRLVSGLSRPLKLPPRTIPASEIASRSNVEDCKCARRPPANMCYNSRLT